MSAIPEKIGKYKIVRPLGSGLMGEVFLGEISTPSGKEYTALKVLNPKMVTRRGDAAKFISEISSENIMRYLAIDPVSTGSDQYYLVMDYLEVRPISRRSLRTTLSDELLEIFATVADACQLAHDKKVLHGNIKPSNVLIRRDQDTIQPILTDFGLEYIYSPDVFVGETFDDTLTYMAPEAARAMVEPDSEIQLTPAADVYSLSMVLLETLIRKRLFQNTLSLDKLLDAKKNLNFMLLNVNYPKKNVEIKRLNDLIRKNLDVEPAKRMQSMTELAEALRAAVVKQAVLA